MYPATVPEREYQVDIIKTALLQNTLVCLPTGLGKTLIAAVLMYNFTRWFPEVLLLLSAHAEALLYLIMSAAFEYHDSICHTQSCKHDCSCVDLTSLLVLPLP